MTKMQQEINEQADILAAIYEKNAKTLDALRDAYKSHTITHICMAGRGTSDFACVYAEYLFGVYLGINSALACPSVLTLYGGKPDYTKSLVIAVSQSGKAADALAVLEEAKAQGAVTVSITNDAESPLALAADYPLLCSAGPEVSVAATKTFTAEMGLFYLLCAKLADNAEMMKNFSKMPPVLAEFLKTAADPIEKLAAPYKDMTHGFILSRGFGYAIALEATLKLQETSYVKTKGFAISDFYHGPLAQVTPDTPVIVYMANGKALKDGRAMLEKLNEIGNRPLVVTDSDTLTDGLDVNLFRVPSTGDEATQNFVFAAFAQLFANCVSRSKGLDPDNPRNLRKVTITK